MMARSPQTDHYAILGVGRTATEREIRTRYRALARQYRPDLNSVAVAWHQIQAAYAVLSNPTRRAEYDAGRDPYARHPAHQSRVEQAEHTLSAHLGVDAPAPNPRGGDVHLIVPQAGSHRLRYQRYVPCAACQATGANERGWKTCPRCAGAGEYQWRRLIWLGWLAFGWVSGCVVCEGCKGRSVLVAFPCPQCRGAGRVMAIAQLSICIPTPLYGVRIKGWGHVGWRGGASGDLLVRVGVAPVSVPAALPEARPARGAVLHRFGALVAAGRQALMKCGHALVAYAREFWV